MKPVAPVTRTRTPARSSTGRLLPGKGHSAPMRLCRYPSSARTRRACARRALPPLRGRAGRRARGRRRSSASKARSSITKKPALIQWSDSLGFSTKRVTRPASRPTRACRKERGVAPRSPSPPRRASGGTRAAQSGRSSRDRLRRWRRRSPRGRHRVLAHRTIRPAVPVSSPVSITRALQSAGRSAAKVSSMLGPVPAGQDEVGESLAGEDPHQMQEDRRARRRSSGALGISRLCG